MNLRQFTAVGLGISVGLCSALLLASEGGPTDYTAAIEKWRQERETRLKADDGWLTVAGLFWLKEGENRFGTDPTDDIVLPAGSAPGLVGVLDFHGGKTAVRVEAGATVTSEGRQVTTMELRPDTSGSPDVLAVGDLSMYVIERGGRYAIRLKDKNNKNRREFTGLKWYPIQKNYRVMATFVEYDPPKQVQVPNVLGQAESLPSPGYAAFTLNGKKLRLDPVLEEPDAKELFFIFRDLTSGEKTYSSGRFLYAEMPKEGKIVLDFNKAYNPPCAFTHYATCPLPPKQNKLPIRIEAGEMDYGHH